jgi:hypothetical protein
VEWRRYSELAEWGQAESVWIYESIGKEGNQRSIISNHALKDPEKCPIYLMQDAREFFRNSCCVENLN